MAELRGITAERGWYVWHIRTGVPDVYVFWTGEACLTEGPIDADDGFITANGWVVAMRKKPRGETLIPAKERWVPGRIRRVMTSEYRISEEEARTHLGEELYNKAMERANAPAPGLIQIE